jgi:heme/copper-type cytochrome/quinol oxidase subunit 1
VSGFTFGALMLGNEGLAFYPNLNHLLPVHIEILIMGWVMQLALGVAYWILPRFTHGLPRGNVPAIWLSLICINAGILLVALSVILNIAWFVLLGRLFETSSVLAFLLVSWRRVRPSG